MPHQSLPLVQELPPQTVKAGRRKLWDLPQKLLCPVIGTCLEVHELRTLAGKADFDDLKSAGDYRLHTAFVGAATSKSYLSVGAQTLLDKKYRLAIKRFTKAKNEQEVMAQWEAHRMKGEIPGGFWALVTHPQCGDQALSFAYEQLHMLSHQVGAAQRIDLGKLAQTQAELEALRDRSQRESAEYAKRLKQKQAQIDALRPYEEDHERLCEALEVYRQQIKQLESRGELGRVKAELTQERAKGKKRERYCRQLEQKGNMSRARIQALEAQLQETRQSLANKEAECERLEWLMAGSGHLGDKSSHPLPDLKGCRVLCVGGRSRVVEHYQELVERCNGEFMHHDGGKEERRQRLDTLLSSSDAVVCPTDCVSHDAYYRCKKVCKHQNKPCLLLQSSGVSTFAKALEALVV